MKNAQEKFQQQQGFVDPEEAKKREGEVKVKQQDSSKTTNSNSKNELGDYVEFEETKN